MLFKFKSTCVELVILAFLVDELFVTTSFDDPPVLKNHDNVGITDC